jgi:hypothetical protein
MKTYVWILAAALLAAAPAYGHDMATSQAPPDQNAPVVSDPSAPVVPDRNVVIITPDDPNYGAYMGALETGSLPVIEPRSESPGFSGEGPAVIDEGAGNTFRPDVDTGS